MLQVQFSDLDLTGLPESFPFDAADVKKFAAERSIRQCLRLMARRYDEIVYRPVGPISPPITLTPELGKRLKTLWEEQLAKANKYVETEVAIGAAFIPEVQNALDGWLQCLHQRGITGSGPWHKVTLVTDTSKGPYGSLCVIRTNGPNAPGIGIAAWLGQAKGQPFDLKQRVGFFKQNPCPIQTLVMLRAEGDAPLNSPGTSKIYEAAVNEGKRDIRVHPYEPKHLHSLIAFTPWYQAAMAELQTAKETNANAEQEFRDFLTKLSAELLGWIESWKQPPASTGVLSKGAKT